MREAFVALALVLAAACNSGEPPPPDLQAIRLPTGARLAPDGEWLFVVNSNLDLAEQNSTLVALSLPALHAGLAAPQPAGAKLDARAPCRWSEGDPAIVECDPARLITRERSVQLPSGAGNIALDLPAGAEGPWRLLVPSGLEQIISWVDVRSEGADIVMDCGQDETRQCATQFQIQDIPKDAARITVDQGARVAYLPHLLGDTFTLIDLDGDFGPEIAESRVGGSGQGSLLFSSTNKQFFGGFAAAVRPCDPAAAPRVTVGCTRPLIYVTQRFWPGIRTLSFNPGLKQIVAFNGLGATQLQDVDPGLVGDRPLTGDLAFEDLAGDRLLLVHTTPPSLARIDTSLGPTSDPLNAEIAVIPLCRNPNLLALYQPQAAEPLAFVSCYSDSQVAVVTLTTFAAVATLNVEAGPNELIVDAARRKLYVVQTLASTIGVVELDHRSPDYLHIVGRVGLVSDE